jgi:hypothetical protein
VKYRLQILPVRALQKETRHSGKENMQNKQSLVIFIQHYFWEFFQCYHLSETPQIRKNVTNRLINFVNHNLGKK